MILLTIVVILVPVLLTVAFFTLAERQLMASMQRRIGPHVSCLVVVLQPIYDGIKMGLALRFSSSSPSFFGEGRDPDNDNKDMGKLSIIDCYNFIYNHFIQGPRDYTRFVSWLDYLVKLVALFVFMVNYLMFWIPFFAYIYSFSIALWILSVGSITMFGMLVNIYSFWYMIFGFCAFLILAIMVHIKHIFSFLVSVLGVDAFERYIGFGPLTLINSDIVKTFFTYIGIGLGIGCGIYIVILLLLYIIS